MNIITRQFNISTHGDSEVIDITEQVRKLYGEAGLSEGQLTVFVIGSTASITTTEFEPGLRSDIPAMLERVAPRGIRYKHDDTWHDGNGHSHVRAALMGCSLTVPYADGKLLLGTWQQIVLIDHDNRPRQRTVVLQLIGK